MRSADRWDSLGIRALTDKMCDFCGDEEPITSYRCTSFEAAPPEHLPSWLTVPMDDDWSACAACAELIDRNDGDALAERSGRAIAARRSLDPAAAIELARTVHDQFFRRAERSLPLDGPGEN